jgi:hypothetical protein
MKSFRSALRVMIAAGSLTGFFSGWVMLAHTLSTSQAIATQPVVVSSSSTVAPLDLQALAPQGNIPAVNTSSGLDTTNQATTNLQPLPTFSGQVTQGNVPRLRTSGS